MKETKRGHILKFIAILGIILVSMYIGMHIGGEAKDTSSASGGSTIEEPDTWLFKDKLTSKDDSNTHKIDLRDKPLGGLLTIEHSISQYTLMLTDSDEMPLFTQNIGAGHNINANIKNIILDGEEIYYLIVKPYNNKYDKDKQYVLSVKFIPHSPHNSFDTAIPIIIPGKVEGVIVSGKDVNWFKIGPLNSSGLIVIDSFIDGDLRNLKTRLLDDKTKVIQEKEGGWQGKVIAMDAPINEGNVYYLVVEQTNKESAFSISFTADIDLIPESPNNNPDNASSISMPATVRGKIVSTEDVNWYKLDLRDYSDGDIIISFAVPDEMFGSKYLTLELLEENQITVVGRAAAQPKKPDAFKRGMTDMRRTTNPGTYYPEEGIEGGKIYYIKVYSNKLYNPSEEYVFEIDPGTMVPQSVANEEPNTYTLTSRTADTAVSVNFPAQIKGKIISEEDTYWFKTNLADYSRGGVLTVTLTMPTKTEPSCEFVCRQPICFNPPSKPKNCYHYQFNVFESDKETEVLTGSVAPKGETTFREILKKGDQYYFKISAPHGRYNTEESYTIDARFYPAE